MHNIAISRLHPHPDNPRQNLGDLSELAESIKANGVLQNLTVVPHDTGYRVVIGHRRLAAAKLAGLIELPCAIVHLARNEQIAIMLAENMQRADLTVYEQAQGIQLMLDLGESVNTIASRTGFSETTIRRRVRLLELDNDKFQQATERGATLMDFAKLDEIKSPELRNKVLDVIGTKNFDYELHAALDQEKLDANRPKWHAALFGFAAETADGNRAGLRYVSCFNVRDDPDKALTVPEDAGKADYFYIMTSLYITLLKRGAPESADPREALYRTQEECVDRLREQANRAFELRQAFVKDFPAAKRKLPAIVRFWMRVKLLGSAKSSGYYFNDTFAKLTGIPPSGTDFGNLAFSDVAEILATEPEKTALLAAYADANDEPRNNYHEKQWHEWPQHKSNKDLDELYAALEELGYQISDDEQALQDGTHELFVKPVEA